MRAVHEREATPPARTVNLNVLVMESPASYHSDSSEGEGTGGACAGGGGPHPSASPAPAAGPDSPTNVTCGSPRARPVADDPDAIGDPNAPLKLNDPNTSSATPPASPTKALQSPLSSTKQSPPSTPGAPEDTKAMTVEAAKAAERERVAALMAEVEARPDYFGGLRAAVRAWEEDGKWSEAFFGLESEYEGDPTSELPMSFGMKVDLSWEALKRGADAMERMDEIARKNREEERKRAEERRLFCEKRRCWTR